MRIIKLDATKWRTILDFYDALLPALGAPKGHGIGENAMIDSMIWGGMNAVEPPYIVRISGAAALPKDVRDHVEYISQALAEGREDYRRLRGGDIEVSIAIEP